MFSKRPISYLFLPILVLAGFIPAVFVFAVTSYGVTTSVATSVCQNGAVLNGYVNPLFATDTIRGFEWGTSQDLLSNQVTSSNTTDHFSQTVYGLAPQTTYYFRAEAKNSKRIGQGEVLSFKTNGGACPGVVSSNTSSGSNAYVPQAVITNVATNISDTSARINAAALLPGSIQTYGWFEWGNTPDLGNISTRRYLGTTGPLSWNEVLSGLTPGTTYFFKAAIENQNSISDGALFSFHTTGVAPVVISPSFTQIFQPTNNNLAIPNKKTSPASSQKAQSVQKPNTATVSDVQKTIKVEVVPNIDTVAVNERVNETVHVENTTDVTQKSIVVRVIISNDAEYISTGGDSFQENGKVLTYIIGDMAPKEKKGLLLWMSIRANAADKTAIETIAVATWEDTTHPNEAESVGRVTITVDGSKIVSPENSVAAVAATKSSGSIFPKNLQAWGAVIGFLFLLLAAYMIFLVTKGKNEDDVLSYEAVPENTPDLSTQPLRADLHVTGVPSRRYSNDPFIKDENILIKQEFSRMITPLTPAPVRKNAIQKAAPPDNLPV